MGKSWPESGARTIQREKATTYIINAAFMKIIAFLGAAEKHTVQVKEEMGTQTFHLNVLRAVVLIAGTCV